MPNPSKLRHARLLGCAALLALAGCTQYQWYKENATQDDFNRDVYACDIESAKAYPAIPSIQPVSPGYMSPGLTRCYSSPSGHTRCFSSPGYFMPPAMGTVDLNEDNRNQAANRCMVARGWRLIEVK